VAQTDKKQRNLIIAIAVMTLAIVSAIGLAVWALSGKTEEKASTAAYQVDTPTAGAAAQQVGSVAIQPEEVAMVRSPDGKFAAVATVSALFQNFTMDQIKVDGDSRIQVKSDCPTTGQVLQAGRRCLVNLSLDPNNSLAGAPASPTPTLNITGTTLTPGGSKQIIETSAKITSAPAGTVDPNAAPGSASGIPGAAGGIAGGSPLTSGQVAPNGIDPYGPVAPNNAPPVNYAQQPVAQPQVAVLSPREQFILARRQAVLGNVVRDGRQQAPQQPKGDWDEIGIKKAVSSLPQDMSRVVTQDRIITAVLARTFDSRQSQQVVAQVDRNVYGATGRNILIPRGSTVIGTMAGTGERVAVVWTQIIRPDGGRFVFEGQGGDAMGQAGVGGRVNNRYMKRITAGFLGTIIKATTALASKAAEQPNTGGSSVVSAGSANNGKILTDIVTADVNSILGPIIQQAQAVQPIITIPGGTRVTIIPTQDLVMHEVQRETVVRQQYPRQMNGGASISASPYTAPQGGNQEFLPANPTQREYQPRTAQEGNIVAQGVANGGAPATLGATPPWGSN
jgi:type IV secretory pathway VirB10-like protein